MACSMDWGSDFLWYSEGHLDMYDRPVDIYARQRPNGFLTSSALPYAIDALPSRPEDFISQIWSAILQTHFHHRQNYIQETIYSYPPITVHTEFQIYHSIRHHRIHFLTVHVYPMQYEAHESLWELGRVNLRNCLRRVQRLNGGRRGAEHAVYGVLVMGRFVRFYLLDWGRMEVFEVQERQHMVEGRNTIANVLDTMLLFHI